LDPYFESKDNVSVTERRGLPAIVSADSDSVCNRQRGILNLQLDRSAHRDVSFNLEGDILGVDSSWIQLCLGGAFHSILSGKRPFILNIYSLLQIMSLLYQKPGLELSRALANEADLVRALQRDLRALGYLRDGIDGEFGAGTEKAVRALQYDLLNNNGESRADDGVAPLALTQINTVGGSLQITTVTGVVDQAFVNCLAALLSDERVPKLPSAVDPTGENAKVAAEIAGVRRSRRAVMAWASTRYSITRHAQKK
jgi:hypothetical protein